MGLVLAEVGEFGKEDGLSTVAMAKWALIPN